MADAPMDDLYLFLFPANMYLSAGHLALHLPPQSEAYYWTFDPEGIERFSEDTSEALGLPLVQFHTLVRGDRGSKDDYTLIREFHLDKGFDPDSQDIAIELGYPLVEVSNHVMGGGEVRIHTQY
jgi:hypothetical protein